MKAMVLAAGRGTRLGALTAARPKALIEVGGVPLLEIVLLRLHAAGVREVIINAHYCAEQIERFVANRTDSALQLTVSREDVLLDTGGGLKHAAWFFAGGGPFLVHNVDVLSDIDLGGLVRAHVQSGALASLAVKRRVTARPLVFDGDGILCGRRMADRLELVREGPAPLHELGFCGIQVISPELLAQLSESGSFSIITSHLRLAAGGARIRAHRVDESRWRDCGRPEDLRPLDP
jgi:NDP-sugar pyrophosphorylase family protein